MLMLLYQYIGFVDRYAMPAMLKLNKVLPEERLPIKTDRVTQPYCIVNAGAHFFFNITMASRSTNKKWGFKQILAGTTESNSYFLYI